MAVVTTEAPYDCDVVAAHAREALAASFAMLSIFDVENSRQLIVGVDGLPVEFAGVREIPMVESYCGYVHDHGCQLVVDDVSQELQIASHPVAHQLGIQSYAGWHVSSREGRTIGVLCVMDAVPRTWTSREVLDLMEMAHACAPLLEELVESDGTPRRRELTAS